MKEKNSLLKFRKDPPELAPVCPDPRKPGDKHASQPEDNNDVLSSNQETKVLNQSPSIQTATVPVIHQTENQATMDPAKLQDMSRDIHLLIKQHQDNLVKLQDCLDFVNNEISKQASRKTPDQVPEQVPAPVKVDYAKKRDDQLAKIHAILDAQPGGTQ